MADDKSQKTTSTTKEDVDKNKNMAIFAYFIFFLPLLTDAKDSKFAKFHANQALLVWLLVVVCSFFSIFTFGLIYLFPAALWIMGIMSASNGQMKRLPLIGGIDIIK